MPYLPCLHVVLHQPQIPHNAGAVGRTCVAVGAKLWLVRPLGFRVDDYYLRRAGLDYWEHLEWEVVDDWAALCERLPPLAVSGLSPSDGTSLPDDSLRSPAAPSAGVWLFTKKAQRIYTQARFERGDVFVYGSESAGLPDSLLCAHGERLLKIPISDRVRSLNVSNAVAVSVYEALRQWGADATP